MIHHETKKRILQLESELLGISRLKKYGITEQECPTNEKCILKKLAFAYMRIKFKDEVKTVSVMSCI